jgi:hypothetical protein
MKDAREEKHEVHGVAFPRRREKRKRFASGMRSREHGYI